MTNISSKMTFKTHWKNGEVVWAALMEAFEEYSSLQGNIKMLTQEFQNGRKEWMNLLKKGKKVSENSKLSKKQVPNNNIRLSSR